MFAGDTARRTRRRSTFTLPQPDGPQAIQVVGIPFDSPGLYLVELASPRLGAALLDKDEPMYVPAAALVTNLSVHFKWARENALVWVTTLDTPRRSTGAHVTVQDCHGTVLGTGDTDAQGIARVTGLPDADHAPRCDRRRPLRGLRRPRLPRLLRRQGAHRSRRRPAVVAADRPTT